MKDNAKGNTMNNLSQDILTGKRSIHWSQELTYLSRPIVDGKPDAGPTQVRTGTRHRYTYRGAVVEIIKDCSGESHLTALLEFAGKKGKGLERELKRRALAGGKKPSELERELCLMVERDVEAAPIKIGGPL